MSSIHLVVMAGGSGTRFWPKSTQNRPKQLLKFGDSRKTLLEETLDRFDGLVSPKNRLIVTTEALAGPIAGLVDSQIDILSEPQARNTAPCIYWAARHLQEKDSQAIMLVMPADHFISNTEAFRKTVSLAADFAANHQQLVTLGIRPSRPETGFGYLRVGQTGETHLPVEAFVEKPGLVQAERFLSAGNYLWNGGMFVWRVETILKAFDQYMPEMKTAWDDARGSVAEAYPKMTATSIDYGVMERAEQVVTFPLDCGWDDVGNWTSLEALGPKFGAIRDENTLISGDLFELDSRGNIVDAENRLVALLGVEDLVIAESGNSLLIARKDRCQDIRKVVDGVRKRWPNKV